ncbi:MAG: tetratricopeptide repeat protein, partial [Alphaproteobacteria bacterium]|nr:tetratricopeptide repeat protein [Alphaproteobacteria bacterium]
MASEQVAVEKLKRATAFHNEGRLKQALALYDEVLARDANNFDALCLSTLAEAAGGNFKAAARRIETALAVRPDSRDAWNIKGDLLMSLGHYRDAVESFGRALKIDPHAPDILNNLGNALSHAGKQ